MINFSYVFKLSFFTFCNSCFVFCFPTFPRTKYVINECGRDATNYFLIIDKFKNFGLFTTHVPS